MYDSVAIANAFVDISKQHPNDPDLTPMKLQKLIYMAHGWHLNATGEPLINDRFEAWQYGPVVDRVYKSFRRFGSSKITSKCDDVTSIESMFSDFYEKPEITNPNILRFLSGVWDGYGRLDGIQLSNKTHEPDTPWTNTYAQRPRGVIHDTDIKAHFDSL